MKSKKKLQIEREATLDTMYFMSENKVYEGKIAFKCLTRWYLHKAYTIEQFWSTVINTFYPLVRKGFFMMCKEFYSKAKFLYNYIVVFGITL